ncbi:MAG TPA: hypothetical protein VF054_07010 [Micromonosporaceae bacterium]
MRGGRHNAVWEPSSPGTRNGMFAFFSSRLGCLGSLLVSALLTALLWLVFAR